MKVIFKRPAEKVGHIEEIPNTLEALQKLVDGYIEPVRINKDNFAIVNEEGLIHRLPYNCTLLTVRNGKKEWCADLVGNIVVVGVDGEDFTDVKMELEDWEECFGWRK